jgi:hypothetical protein
MIIFQNSLITLDYLPDYDILSFDWPDIEPFEKEQFLYSMDKLIEMLKNYDVKNLLLDVSKSTVKIPYGEYQELLRDLAVKTGSTRVQRVARVTTVDPERETNVNLVREESNVHYQYQDFKTKEEALRWLISQSKKEGP